MTTAGRRLVLLWPKEAALDALAYLSLFKLKIVSLLAFASAVAAFVAAGGPVPPKTLLLLLAAGSAASTGAGALNHYFDRDVDALMTRTKRRPLPSGRIRSPSQVLWVGLILVGAGLLLASQLNYLVTFWVFMGAFIYVVVYTLWLKKESPWNIVIGGLAGSCAVMAGWSAVRPELSGAPILMGLLMFLWTPPHFWSLALALKDDYKKAGLPMLPVVVGEDRAIWAIFLSTFGLVGTSFLLYLSGPFGLIYLVSASFSGGAFLAANVALLTAFSREKAWLNFKLSGIYLLLLLLGMLIDTMVL